MRRDARQLVFVFLVAIVPAISSASSPWEIDLGGLETKVQARVRSLCTDRARSRVYGTVNGVQSIAVSVADPLVIPNTNFSANLSGVQNTNLPYMFLRLGLREIVYDARLTGDKGDADGLVRFDTFSRNASRSDQQNAKVEIVYSNATGPEDAALGIYGRTIQIRLVETGSILADRTEYYWFHGRDPRTRTRSKEAICPSFTSTYGYLPGDFIGEVVNPKSYPCMATFTRGMAAAEAESSRKFALAYRTNELPSWSAEKSRQEKQLFDSLTKCEHDYFRSVQPRDPAIEWNRRW